MPPSDQAPLAGLRVLDFGQYVAGPLAAMMLADQGAEVIRIDPPGGPRWATPANAVLQRGKHSLVLDLRQPAERGMAQDLTTRADILIENFRPGVMERFGLGAARLTAGNPRLIYAALPGFAPQDRRAALPGWEIVLGAAAGLYTPYAAARPGSPLDQPIVSAIPIASNFAAFVAVNSILAALLARARTGLGQVVQVPLFAAAFEAFASEAQAGLPPTHNSFHPAADNRFLCADDRWVQLLLIAPRHLAWFVDRFLPEAAAKNLGDVEVMRADPDAGAGLVAAIAALFKTEPAAHWEAVVNAAGIPLAICQTIDHFLTTDAQARAAGAVIPLTDPELGPTSQLGLPVRLSACPHPVITPRQALDAGRAAAQHWLATPPPALPIAPDARPPLDGTKIIDISQVLAAPSAARILAEFGAEVIKINKPGNWIIGHLHFNSGKDSVLLDIAAPEGRAALLSLVRGADVLIDNFRPELAARLRLTAADLAAVNPSLVRGTVTPYTSTGPRQNHRGWEPVGQAVTGLQLRTGGGAPHLARVPLCDFGAGHLLAFAVLLGLWQRQRTGAGQHVESSLMQAGAYHQAPYMLHYAGQQRHELSGLAARGWSASNRLYQTQDGWLAVAVQPGQTGSFLAALDLQADLDGGGEAALAQRFSTLPTATWLARLAPLRIAAHELRSIEQNMTDPALAAAGLSVLRLFDGTKPIRTIGPVPAFSRNPLRMVNLASPPGRETRIILSRVAGSAAAAALIAAGTAAEALPPSTMVVW